MRQRIPDSSRKKTPQAEKAAASTDIKAKIIHAPAQHRHKQRKKQLRGFVIATAGFILLLALYYVFLPRVVPASLWPKSLESGNDFKIPTSADVALLAQMTEATRANVTLPSFDKLCNAGFLMGSVVHTFLERVVAREASAGEGWPDLLAHFNVPRKPMELLIRTLGDAATVMYDVLDSMLPHNREDAPLSQVPKHLPRTLFAWLTTATYLHGTVLPEAALLTQDADAHTRILLRLGNLLSWASDESLAFRHNGTDAVFSIFNWTSQKNACELLTQGKAASFKHFCDTSMSSADATLVRWAAALEELIALHNDYAPFRLHYLAALAQLHWHQKVSLETLTSTVAAQVEKLDSYRFTDQHHRDLLRVLAIYTETEPLARNVAARTTLKSALTNIGGCRKFYRVGDVNATWPTFGEYRPTLFAKSFVHHMFRSLQHRGWTPDIELLRRYSQCVSP